MYLSTTHFAVAGTTRMVTVLCVNQFLVDGHTSNCRMIVAAGNVNFETNRKEDGSTWPLLAMTCLVPAAGYSVVIALALAVVFGFREPARWVAQSLLAATWSAPFFWLLAIGGPLLAVIISMTTCTNSRKVRRVDRGCCSLAVLLLFANVATCLPFPWAIALID